MSDKPLPSFRSIAAPLDVDDAALDDINARLGVPTLTKPQSGEVPSRKLYRFKVDKEEAEAAAPGMAPARAPLEKLTIEVPAYLSDALKRSALETRTTVRHVVMSALKAAGFEVAADDLVPDGRRTRHKNQ